MLEFLEVVFKIVFVAVVLAICGFVLAFIAAAYIGIAQALRRNTEPEPQPELEPQQQRVVDLKGYVLVPVVVFREWVTAHPEATAMLAATLGDNPAADDELRRLREMAGLGEKGLDENGGAK